MIQGETRRTLQRVAEYWSIHTDRKLLPCDVAAMMFLFKAARIKENSGDREKNISDLVSYITIWQDLMSENLAVDTYAKANEIIDIQAVYGKSI